MKKLLCSLAAAGLLVMSLAACTQHAGAQDTAGEDAVTVTVICQSQEVYQIFYTTYLEGEEYGMGGWADQDHVALTPESNLTAVFTKDYFEGRDPSTLAMDFSPYGEGDTVEIATTPQVSIPAKYGESYTIVFSGDEESGFTAQLQK